MHRIINLHNAQKVTDRIITHKKSSLIELSDEEKLKYRGAGDSVARFVDGKLVKILYPLKEIDLSHNGNIDYSKVMDISLKWVGESDGVFFMVTCKGCNLYNPVQIVLDNDENINKFINFIKSIVVRYNHSVDEAREVRRRKSEYGGDCGD